MTADGDAIRASFAVPARGYDLLIGRYLPMLAPAFADAAGVRAGMSALDVGCGPGGLTSELVDRLGASAVAAVDPSGPFVQACRADNAGVDVRLGFAEELPFADASFDATLASLVVPFMDDAPAGIGEMLRVTRAGGAVAACMWNYDRMPLINTFFGAAAEIDPTQQSESLRLGTQQGQLAGLLIDAGLTGVVESELAATAQYSGFEDWWSPMPLGVGPPGAFYRSIDADSRKVLRARCFELLGRPDGPFALTGHAWCAVGRHRAQ